MKDTIPGRGTQQVLNPRVDVWVFRRPRSKAGRQQVGEGMQVARTKDSRADEMAEALLCLTEAPLRCETPCGNGIQIRREITGGDVRPKEPLVLSESGLNSFYDFVLNRRRKC